MERPILKSLLINLESKKLNLKILESQDHAIIFEFDVYAKPGARVEKNYISNAGALIVQTRAKPVDGEANKSIIEKISEVFGIPKSNIEFIRGEKSKTKRFKVLLELTANKSISFYEKKINEIEVQSA